MSDNGNNQTKVTVTNSKRVVEDIYFEDCPHCAEKIPVVGKCSTCNTDYIHVRTVENYETEFLHYVYECSGCPEGQRKAQKIVKISTPSSSKNGMGSDSFKEMTKNFLY